MNPYLEAARPRTLTAAVAPVLVGTAAATADGGQVIVWRALAAGVVAVAVQVAVNYANDYFDGVAGVDTEARLGPRRAVASGLISPSAMKRGMVVAFAVCCLAGLALAAATSWWLLAVGAACVLAALGYSGGPSPYASAGLGELFVFIFFGIVATVGSAFVQFEQLTLLALVASVPVGLLAVAIMLANNLRDIPTDEPAGKRTLAVTLGDARTRALLVGTVVGAVAFALAVAGVAGSAWPLLGLLALAPAAGPVRLVRDGAAGRDLIGVLGGVAKVQIIFGVLLAVGLWLA